jgi:tetratricopeptide (TPR) repeat protein
MSLPPPELMPVMEQFRAGNMAGVLEEAEAILRNDPASVPALALAGLAAMRIQMPERAIPHLQAHVKLAPADNAARLNLATALVQLEKNEEALAIVAGARNAPLARLEGYLYQQQSDFERAGAAYERAVSDDPEDYQSWNNLANVRADSGDVDGSIAAFEQAITLEPDTVELYINLAQVLAKADRQAPRLVAIRDAAEKAPDNPTVLTELGLALGANDRMDEAVDKLKAAVDIYASQGDRQLRDAHLELGVLLETMNQIEALEELVAKCDALGMKEAELAFLKAWLFRRQGDFEAAAAFAAQIPDTVIPARTAKLRGDIADRLGNVEEAIAQYGKMNAAVTQESPPSKAVETYRERVEKQTAFWKPEQLSKLSSVSLPNKTIEPVFLVGFPRSGTTLLDTMLMGNPQLHVMEEKQVLTTAIGKHQPETLLDMDSGEIAAIREQYFNIARDLAPGGEGKRLVDKHPLLMTRIPEIYALFPNAQVILAERHPYDVVLSCYMANFQLNSAMRSFTSLEEAAHTYDVVFTSWENTTGNLPIAVQSVRYERLVADPAGEMKPLISWLGLEWHDSILDTVETARERGRIRTASYSQVTEPVYTRASGRWQRYRDQLQDVMPILAPWAEKMGYPID